MPAGTEWLGFVVLGVMVLRSLFAPKPTPVPVPVRVRRPRR